VGGKINQAIFGARAMKAIHAHHGRNSLLSSVPDATALYLGRAGGSKKDLCAVDKRARVRLQRLNES